MTEIFTVRDITVRFGGLVALSKVTLDVHTGTVHAIIGPNGSGKTTLVNVCTGILSPARGCVRLAGADVTSRPPSEISRRGAARTFQNVNLFPEASVIENVLVAAETRHQGWLVGHLLGTPKARNEESLARDAAVRWLNFVGLGDRTDNQAGSLPYGSQRMLEMARALATDPMVIFLDEPGAGLNEAEMHRLAELICKLRDTEIAVVLIEHNMPFVMSIADHITVLNFGKKIAEGTPEKVSDSPDVIDAYLGIEEEEE